MLRVPFSWLFCVFCNLLDEGDKKAMHCFLKCIRLKFHRRIVEEVSAGVEEGRQLLKEYFCLLSNLPPISQAELASLCFVLLSKTTHLTAGPVTGLQSLLSRRSANSFLGLVSSHGTGRVTLSKTQKCQGLRVFKP